MNEKAGDRARQSQIIKRLWGYFSPYTRELALSLVLVLVASAIPGVLVFLIQKVLDDVLIARDSRLLALMPGAVVALYALNGGVAFSRGMLTRNISWRVMTKIRQELYQHMLVLDVGWHQRMPSGERVSRLVADVNNLQYATSGVVTAIQKPITLIILIISAFIMNPKLAAVALCVLPLIAIPIDRFGKRVRSASRAAIDSGAKLSSLAHESLSGIRVVQIFGGEPEISEKFGTLNRQHHHDQIRAMAAQLLPSPVVELIAALGVGAAIWIGGKDVFANTLQPGELISFLLALGLMNDPLKGLTNISTLLQRSLASAEVIFALLDRPSVLEDAGTQTAPVPQKITFENIYFSYGEGPILHNVSLTVPAGERIALVGASGAGKSTLLALVARLRDPERGRICWNDTDIRAFSLQSLRAQIAVVTQEPFLFDDTIANNISFGQKNTSLDQIIAAARIANAHAFIESLPHGYQTRVDELGMRLSGGQRQRICIARAVLRRAPVLLLDEATSNLDAESEALVTEALDRLMHGCTTFVVAHRLSTVRTADRILVMEQGQIVEEGRHSELVAQDGVYARLLRKQAGELDG